eukprot:TRINITY_DN96294_c0_g1_i1.p3 TRINITY_DN96294_c0_g1~~TRINITY_DN96294_c0_g1_i1.p3  ORF type:complete len:131 (+),score=13.93 TRINITY_DN96294_c0_g1_i1:38-394(+)
MASVTNGPVQHEELVRYQRQRRYPLFGWSDNLHPGELTLVDESGERAIFVVQAPAGWEWAGDWYVCLDGDSDESGWQYAATWEGPWLATGAGNHSLRRRKWLRSRVRSLSGDTNGNDH